MSRGWPERRSAWEAWAHLLACEGWQIVAFEHQCGSVSHFELNHEVGETCCAGCRFEIQFPEVECTPLYRPATKADYDG